MERKWKWMVGRFSAYGFLKNLQFFEVFLILFLRQKGLSFLEIGTLVGITQFTVLILEIPTGVIADIVGRRKAMVFCFIAYIISFIVYYVGTSFLTLLPAVIFYGVGDAFRSGTHKAMIFEYLDIMGIPDQKVNVYGKTRSWSQVGSALSSIIAAVLVFIRENYGIVFLASIVPFLLDLALILTYPKELDGAGKSERHSVNLIEFIKTSFRSCWWIGGLRVGLLNSSLDKGIYRVAKTYLQPVLKSTAVLFLLPVLRRYFPAMSEEQAIAVAVGFVYSIIYLGNSQAARRAFIIERWLGGNVTALNVTYLSYILISIVAFLALKFEVSYLAIIAFVIFALINNMRRPMILSYLGEFMDRAQRATILSVEEQLGSLISMAVGPLMGLCADMYGIPYVFVVSIVIFSILGIPVRIRSDSEAKKERF